MPSATSLSTGHDEVKINESSANIAGWKPSRAWKLAPKPIRNKSKVIFSILCKYRLPQKDVSLKNWSRNAPFLDQIAIFVSANEPVRLLLPAFPFKSPNRTDKVLGALPDAGEEVALMHLNGMAAAIKDVYEPGAKVHVISDGLIYNDILGVDDEQVWDYGEALRRLAKRNQLDHLDFLRQHDFIRVDCMSKEEYLRNATKIRREIIKYKPLNLDFDTIIATDPDLVLTYRGYIRFLKLDLAQDCTNMTKTQREKHIKEVAKKMILRGWAFRAAIMAKYPGYVRLSIHPSAAYSKISVYLIPQEGRVQTPWHSALVRAVDGTITMSHAAEVSNLTHELIFENGRPSYFRERSDLFNWPGLDVSFKYLYPTGILISARSPDQSYSFRDVPMQKIRRLATLCSPVVLRGFRDTTDEEVFTYRASDLGVPAPWTFGLKASIKNAHGENPDIANAIVTSNEAMPMHQDGFFFLVPKVQPDGTTTMVSSQPRFQYLSAISPSTPGSGYTLFASSALLFKNLPAPHTVGDLKKLTWDCRHSCNWEHHMNHLPLVTSHPDTGKDCLRFLEPWPQWKTKFAYNRVSIENGPCWYLDLLTDMLYDHRVTLRFAWATGDILVSDNINMLHTRTAFSDTERRELWRIHVN
ncbi:hypothetical protein CDD81_1785 [Ophiocordyceps australis]|uniref:TauD/TfdA-like domain-containing protein n=1 Tax=Ophiocordyceps australis TaxID=1399860 RepID=A0A2C5XB70_9HYPO|nr:hypothetical protein CDD81_1785 [Ophiocordyceps australis]